MGIAMALRMTLSSPAINETEPKDAKMKKLTSSLTVLATAAALSLGAASVAQTDDHTVKAAFLYVGPVSDHGWSYAHDQARLAMEEELGDMVETTYWKACRKAPMPCVPWNVLRAPAMTSSSQHPSATWSR
jgi:hypothetical protein